MSTHSIDPPIDTIHSSLTEWPHYDHARSLLISLAQAITPLLNHHSPTFQITSLQEFFPESPAQNGAFEPSSPRGQGHNIYVRLRLAEDFNQFHPLGFMVDAVLEQLAEMKAGGREDEKKKVWDGLRGEYTGHNARYYERVEGSIELEKKKKDGRGDRVGESRLGSVASTLRANSRNRVGSKGPRSQVTAASVARFPPSNAPRSNVPGSARSSTSRYPPAAIPSVASTSRYPPLSAHGREPRPQSSASRPPLSTRGRQLLPPPSRPRSRATSRARSSTRTDADEPRRMERLAEALEESIYQRDRALIRAPSHTPSFAFSRCEEDRELVNINNNRSPSTNPPESYYGPSPSQVRSSSRARTFTSRRPASGTSSPYRRDSSQPRNITVQNVNIYNFGNGRGSPSRVEQSSSSSRRYHGRSHRVSQSVRIDMGNTLMGGMSMGPHGGMRMPGMNIPAIPAGDMRGGYPTSSTSTPTSSSSSSTSSY